MQIETNKQTAWRGRLMKKHTNFSQVPLLNNSLSWNCVVQKIINFFFRIISVYHVIILNQILLCIVSLPSQALPFGGRCVEQHAWKGKKIKHLASERFLSLLFWFSSYFDSEWFSLPPFFLFSLILDALS